MSVIDERLLAPLERPAHRFSDQSVNVLREMVLSGGLRPGDRLNEVELAAALGISRGPLREAIQRLCSEGLLLAVPNRGAYVRTFSPNELVDLYEVRIALETHAVRLAARLRSQEAAAELGALLEDTSHSLSQNGGYPVNLDFHLQLAQLAGSQALLDSIAAVNRKVAIARTRSGHQPARAQQAFEEHRVILGHVAAGRGAAAAKMLARHLAVSRDNAIRVLEAAAGG